MQSTGLNGPESSIPEVADTLLVEHATALERLSRQLSWCHVRGPKTSAPEEVYLVLSPGLWWQEGRGWHEPGIGGTVHHAPNVRHAMRSGSSPLLANWCLGTS